MHFVSFTFLAVIAFLTPFPVFLFGALLYMFIWTGYELLFIAVCIDILFGTTNTSFLYTLTTGALLLTAEVLRPYLSWYTSRI